MSQQVRNPCIASLTECFYMDLAEAKKAGLGKPEQLQALMTVVCKMILAEPVTSRRVASAVYVNECICEVMKK